LSGDVVGGERVERPAAHSVASVSQPEAFATDLLAMHDRGGLGAVDEVRPPDEVVVEADDVGVAVIVVGVVERQPLAAAGYGAPSGLGQYLGEEVAAHWSSVASR
jgi:hypothetical protein